jgi:transposase
LVIKAKVTAPFVGERVGIVKLTGCQWSLNRSGKVAGSDPREDGAMSSTSRRYSPEVRERAVRLVFEHQHEHESQWAAIVSVAAKIGCTSETLRGWVRRAEVDEGRRPGVTSDERARLRELERENRELRRANEILKSASLFFATELDGRTRR